jgi:hypothetical protein
MAGAAGSLTAVVTDDPLRFYLVYAQAADAQALQANFDAVWLRDDLFAVHTRMTRSELYHAVRDLCVPDALLVAPLAAHPKFRGMAPGALKWFKQRSND